MKDKYEIITASNLLKQRIICIDAWFKILNFDVVYIKIKPSLIICNVTYLCRFEDILYTNILSLFFHYLVGNISRYIICKKF